MILHIYIIIFLYHDFNTIFIGYLYNNNFRLKLNKKVIINIILIKKKFKFFFIYYY